MVSFKILAGGTGTLISTFVFNSGDNASLTLLGQTTSGTNPSWIAIDPRNSSVLYAVNEQEDGQIQSFYVKPDGLLTGPIDTVSSGGNGPAHAEVLKDGQVAVTNFGGGNGVIVPTTDGGLRFDNSTVEVITFPLKGEASNPHMALQRGDEVFVPDLGGDTIFRLAEDGAPGKWKIIGNFDHTKDSGPRHIAVYEDILYTLHEKSNTLTQQAFPQGPNGTALPFLADVSILPTEQVPNATFAAAEILIPTCSSPFSTVYIYVSNRSLGPEDPRGDTIVIFERTTKWGRVNGLRRVGEVFTGLSLIRGMQFSPVVGGEQFLVASGQKGTGGTVVYKRVAHGGLEEVARNLDLESRTSFAWVA